MKVKSAPVSIKAVGDDGTFEALVSVFNNVDSYGDVMMPGAFADVLGGPDPIPVIWSHQWGNPDAHIGIVEEAEERGIGGKAGLWVRGRIDTDDDSPTARQVLKLLKARRVRQFSFAYDVADGGWGEREEKSVYEIRKVGNLYEVGPTLVGANQETDLLSSPAAIAKAVTAARGESFAAELRQALSPTAPPEKPSGPETGQTKDEEPPGAKSEESTGLSPASLALVTELQLAELA